MQSCHAKRFINIANFRWDTCCDNMLLNAKNTVLFHGCITTRHSCIIPCTYNTVIIACQLHILWVDWGKEKRMYHGEGSGISKNNIHMLISLYIIMCVVKLLKNLCTGYIFNILSNRFQREITNLSLINDFSVETTLLSCLPINVHWKSNWVAHR